MKKNQYFNMFRFPKPFIFTFLTLISITSCDDPTSGNQPMTADVAIYTDVGSWDTSVIACMSMLDSSGFTFDTIGIDEILSDRLNEYLILLLPGGNPRDITSGLGPVGRSRIRSFVSSGGGFIGLGGGSALADSSSGIWPGIGLFNGQASWPIETIAVPPHYAITDIELADPYHPVGLEGPTHYQTLYYGGPQFLMSNPLEVDVIFNYVATGNPAAIAFEYRGGRVFLAGFQPEIEENDDRDGVDFGDDLTDPDSEWDMLEKAVKFCLWEL